MKRCHRAFSLKNPEATAAIRNKCINRVKVVKYFAALREVLDQYPNLLPLPSVHGTSMRQDSLWSMIPAKLLPGRKFARISYNNHDDDDDDDKLP